MLTMHSLLTPTKKPTSVPARRPSGSSTSANKSSSKPPPLSSSSTSTSSSASKARVSNAVAKLTGASKTPASSSFSTSPSAGSSAASTATTPSKPKLTIATSSNSPAPLSHSPHSANASSNQSNTNVLPITSPNAAKLRSRSGSNSTSSSSSSAGNPSPSSSVSSTASATPGSLSSLPKSSTPTSFPSLVSPATSTALSSYPASFASSFSSTSIVSPSPSLGSSANSVSFLAAPASPIHSASPSQRKLKQALQERLTPKPGTNGSGNSNGNGNGNGVPTGPSPPAFNFRLDEELSASSSSSFSSSAASSAAASAVSAVTGALSSLSLSATAEEEVAVEPVLFSPNYEAHDHEEVEKESKKAASKILDKKATAGRNRGSSVKAILKDKDKLIAAGSVVAAIVAQTHTHSAKDAVAVLPAAKPAIAAAAAVPAATAASSSAQLPPMSPKTAAVATYTYTPPTVQNGGLEEDEFDPFLFIKSLPPLSSLPVALSRPAKYCLPKKSGTAPMITLALDLDETLVHCSVVPLAKYDLQFNVNFNGMNYAVYVKRRPFLFEFLEKVSQWFEVLVFTASQKVYADKLLNILDPARKFVQHRVFRDSCLCIEGNYLKDLTVLGRDLQKTIIIDNSIQAFAYQLNNGIPIESWFDDESDRELLNLIPFLEQLKNVDDIRPIIRDAFRLQEIVDNLKV